MTLDYILKFATFNFAIASPQTGLWRGKLVLRDLKVRADVSRKLRLPIVLEQGCVEFLRLEVSFKYSNKLCKTFWIKTASHCRWAGLLQHPCAYLGQPRLSLVGCQGGRNDLSFSTFSNDHRNTN